MQKTFLINVRLHNKKQILYYIPLRIALFIYLASESLFLVFFGYNNFTLISNIIYFRSNTLKILKKNTKNLIVFKKTIYLALIKNKQYEKILYSFCSSADFVFYKGFIAADIISKVIYNGIRHYDSVSKCASNI
jgi:hypothetical protein